MYKVKKKLWSFFERKKMSLRIATLNVHNWADADHEDNMKRVIALVKVSTFYHLQLGSEKLNKKWLWWLSWFEMNKTG